MERVPEPELMDSEEQAAAYAAADFDEPNRTFVERVLAEGPDLTGASIVDLGCGPGDIAIRLCRALPEARVAAVDGSAAMLGLARRAVAEAGVSDRVRLVQALLPGGLEGEQFDAVISNSLLHHLPEPLVLWREVRRLGRPGAFVLVADLFRPESRAAASAIVDRYAAEEPEVLRQDFFNSLLAAFTLDEVRDQLRQVGLDALRLHQVSDRHLVVSGHLP